MILADFEIQRNDTENKRLAYIFNLFSFSINQIGAGDSIYCDAISLKILVKVKCSFTLSIIFNESWGQGLAFH